jgi:type IV pilus assembly protein PilV
MSRLGRGYTVIELMMALAVLAIGASGIIALQNVTVTSNQHAKNLALASHIAQAWQEQLAADSVAWNHPSLQQSNSDLSDTKWLNAPSDPPRWVLPSYEGDLNFGPAFDALGNVVVLPAQQARTRFCTHIRLTELYPSTRAGNGLLRAEVRVFWLRNGVDEPSTFCDRSDDPEAISDDVETYHFVYKASAVRQNAPQL